MALTYLLLRSHPLDGGKLRDGIDMALAYGAFELPLQLIFAGEAVLALQTSWNAAQGPEGDYLSQLGALALYDMVTPWVCSASLQHFGIKPEQLRIPLQRKSDAELVAVGPRLLVY